MKITPILAALTLAAAMTSCGGSGQTENAPFDTPDLTWAGLTGHVKECVTQSFVTAQAGDSWTKEGVAQNTRTLTFDKEGLLTSDRESTFDFTGPKYVYTTDEEGKTTAKAEGDDTRTITLGRDGDGRIVEMSNKSAADPEYDDMQFTITYTWVKGNVIKHGYSGWEWGAEERFILDDRGRPTASIMVNVDLGEGMDTEKAYTYLADDNHGNWISRVVKISNKGWEENPATGDKTYSEPEVSYFLEERTITYY